MPKTYENLIQTREVALAIEQLLVAPYGTTWDATRIYLNSAVPTGFTHLGAVVEDTPQLTIGRERFQLQTGIPRVLQYQAVRGVTGQFQMSLHSNSNRAVRFAVGNVGVYKYIVNSFGNAVAVESHTGVTAIWVGTAGAQSFVAGDVIAIGATADALTRGDNEAEVYISTLGWLYLTSPGAVAAISDDDVVAKITHTTIPFGTIQMPNFHVLGVADFIDGVQVIHDFQKASPTGEWTEQIRPDANVQTAVQFDLMGYSTTRYSTTGELIVGERVYIPKTP